MSDHKKEFKLNTLQSLVIASIVHGERGSVKDFADLAASVCEEAERRGWFKEL